MFSLPPPPRSSAIQALKAPCLPEVQGEAAVSKCQHCDRPESEHHAFEPAVVRTGICQCGDTWVSDVPLVCDAFIPHEKWRDMCKTCEHDEACHKVSFDNIHKAIAKMDSG